MKKLYLFFNIFLILFILSCNQQVLRNQVNDNTIQKELTKYVTISWKLNPNYITNLPPKVREKLIKSCNSNKYVLVKLSTTDFENTKGTFRCN